MNERAERSSSDRSKREGQTLRRSVRFLFALSALVFACVYVLSGIYVVRPEQKAVVVRFGKCLPIESVPGTHYRLPYPIDRVIFFKPNEVKSVLIGGTREVPLDATPATASSGTSSSEYLTGDENIIHIVLNAQYRIQEPAYDYLFRTVAPDVLIRWATQMALADTVARSNVDDLLTAGKQVVLTKVKQDAQRKLDEFGAGVSLLSVTFSDVSPPQPVVDAFKNVASAMEDRDRIVNEAMGDYNETIPKARGEAEFTVREALALKEASVNRARGESERFLSVLGEFEQSADGETALLRLYIEAMEDILPDLRKYVVNPTGRPEAAEAPNDPSKTASQTE